MIPELCKQMERSHSCDHDLRDTKQCRGKQQNSEQVEKCGDTLTKGASQIKFLAAVMDYMQIPEEIDLVTPPVNPISIEIEYDECEYINQPLLLDVGHGKLLQ
jgi:hypothetical protein